MIIIGIMNVKMELLRRLLIVPRIKKSTVTTTPEIQPIIPQEGELSIISKNEKGAEKAAKIPKEKFKQLHIKDTYWLENDIYQTIADMTEGKKGAKALIINKALKDYFKKNKIAIKPLKVKGKKD